MKYRIRFTAAAAILAAFTLFSASANDPAANWDKHCTKCHGADGKGDTKMGKKAGVKDMSTAEYHAKLTDDQAFKAIKQGVKEGGKEKMKPAPAELSDDDINALVAYMRKLKK